MPDALATAAERLALIQPVAYHLQLLGREEARNAELHGWLLERFLDLAPDKKQAQALIRRFLTFLEGRSGLLIARDLQDRYAFPHKTFQEYLAARELIYRGSAALHDEVLRQRHAPTWREVILLTVGHLMASGQPDQAKQLGWKLLEADQPGTPEAYRTLALLGELVVELGGNLGPLLRAALQSPGLVWWAALHTWGRGTIALFVELPPPVGQIAFHLQGDEPELAELLTVAPPADGRHWDGLPKQARAGELARAWLAQRTGDEHSEMSG